MSNPKAETYFAREADGKIYYKRCHEAFCGLPDITLRIGYDHVINCPGPPGRLSALSVFYSKSVLCGAFVWARRVLNAKTAVSGPGRHRLARRLLALRRELQGATDRGFRGLT